jgi:hypothetical protein
MQVKDKFESNHCLLISRRHFTAARKGCEFAKSLMHKISPLLNLTPGLTAQRSGRYINNWPAETVTLVFWRN